MKSNFGEEGELQMAKDFSYAKDNQEKQRIFDIAMALMDDIGYEKMTIRRICQEAEISTGKFYHYFCSKQELLSFFYQKAQEKYISDCQANLANKDLRTQIIDFYVWYAEYVENFGIEFVSNFFTHTNPALNMHIYNNPIIQITDDLLINAIQSGYVLKQNQTVREISNDLCIIVKGIIFDWCIRHGEYSLKESVNHLLSKCIEGFF